MYRHYTWDMYGWAFAAGAAGYSTLELVFRGYTHWTMALAGGICVCLLLMIQEQYPFWKLWQKALVGTAFITMTEFVVGCVVNLWLGWNVWDYSELQVHFWGQISPIFSLLWFFLCLPLFWMFQRLLR